MGLFEAAHGWKGVQKGPLPKICHTYPTTMKLGTVIPYVESIQKIHTVIYMVTIFMMSAKSAILGLLKIKVFLMKVYDVIFFSMTSPKVSRPYKETKTLACLAYVHREP